MGAVGLELAARALGFANTRHTGPGAPKPLASEKYGTASSVSDRSPEHAKGRKTKVTENILLHAAKVESYTLNTGLPSKLTTGGGSTNTPPHRTHNRIT